jgi:ATP-dependent Clp endopeptidase proteolytic subunit ClpP
MTKQTQLLAIKEQTDSTVLSFFGPIAEQWWDDEKCFDEAVVAKAFAQIDPKKPLDVYINSPGGDVSSALAINGILSRHKAPVTIHVTGLAASAATLITSLANARTVISKGSLFMIHNPLSSVYGNAEELEKQADVLNKCAESMRAIYRAKTGLEDKEIKSLMDAETWFTAEEAVAKGFADELDDNEPVSAELKGDHILAIAGKEWDISNLPHLKKEILMVKNNPKPATTEAEVQTEAVAEKAENKKVEALTAERLNAEHPELFKAIVAEAVQCERNRIRALADIDCGANHELVVKAMFEEPMTAEQVAIETIKAQKAQQETKAQAIAEDATALATTLQDCAAAEGALPEDKDAAARESLIASVHANLKKLNGYK